MTTGRSRLESLAITLAARTHGWLKMAEPPTLRERWLRWITESARRHYRREARLLMADAQPHGREGSPTTEGER